MMRRRPVPGPIIAAGFALTAILIAPGYFGLFGRLSDEAFLVGFFVNILNSLLVRQGERTTDPRFGDLPD